MILDSVAVPTNNMAKDRRTLDNQTWSGNSSTIETLQAQVLQQQEHIKQLEEQRLIQQDYIKQLEEQLKAKK